MCKVSESKAVTCDFTREQSQSVAEHLIAATTKMEPSPEWFPKLWEANVKHSAKLGETLRRELCVPAMTGEELFKSYQNVFAETVGCTLPPIITPADCETQKVAAKKGQRLGRALAAYLKELDAKYHSGWNDDSISKLIDKVQTTIKGMNGLKLVLSANPLDKLLASNFADYASGTCHRWFPESKESVGEYAAGNFTYAGSPDCLVLYAYSDYKIQFDVKLPRKISRQMIFIPEGDYAYISRVYGITLNELVHQQARQLVAEFLAGSPNPTWRLHSERGGGRQGYASATISDYAYTGDSIHRVVRIGEYREHAIYPSQETAYYRRVNPADAKGIGYQVKLPPPLCPCCAKSRSDSLCGQIACKRCNNYGRCAACGDVCDVDEDYTANDNQYCAECFAARFCTCEECGDTMGINSGYPLEDGRICRICGNNGDYTYCDSCGYYVPGDQYAGDGLCVHHAPDDDEDEDEDEVGEDETAPAQTPAQTPVAPSRLERVVVQWGRYYRRYDGRVVGPMIFNSHLLDPRGIDRYRFRTGTSADHDTYGADGRYCIFENHTADVETVYDPFDLVAELPDEVDHRVVRADCEIVAGGYYYDRSGEVVGPITENDTGMHTRDYPFVLRSNGGLGSPEYYMSANGRFYGQNGPTASRDLVAPAPAPLDAAMSALSRVL